MVSGYQGGRGEGGQGGLLRGGKRTREGREGGQGGEGEGRIGGGVAGRGGRGAREGRARGGGHVAHHDEVWVLQPTGHRPSEGNGKGPLGSPPPLRRPPPLNARRRRCETYPTHHRPARLSPGSL